MSFAAAPCHMTERYSKRKSRISLIMPLRNRFMKIAIDIRALMEGKTTGVEVYLVNLLHELFKIDSKNQYVLFANSFRAVSLPSFNYSNVKLIVTKYPNKIFNLSQKLGFLQMEKLLGPVDLFFSPHWRVVALKSSTPLVVTFHDLFFEIIPEFFTARRRLWHAFMDYPKAARRAKKIIAVSDNTKKDLEDLYGIENSKIKVVYPGMNPPRPSAPSLNQYFLYFGTLEPRKNIQTNRKNPRCTKTRLLFCFPVSMRGLAFQSWKPPGAARLWSLAVTRALRKSARTSRCWQTRFVRRSSPD